MKKAKAVFFAVLALASLTALGYERELMRIGFEQSEGYELGSVIGQQSWRVVDGRHNYDSSVNSVEDGIGPDSSRALRLEGGNNFPGFDFDLSEMEIDPETEYLAFSFQFRPMRDEAGKGGIDSYIKLCNVDGSGWTWPPALAEGKNWNGESFRCYGYNLQKNQNEWLILPYETNYWYNEICYTLDLRKHRIVSWQVGSLVTNVPMAYQSQRTLVPNWAGFELYGYVDDICLKAVSKPAAPGAKIETYTKALVLDREVPDFSFEVLNSGTNKVGYVVSFEEDPGWVEALNGKGSIDPDGKTELKFRLLREDMGDYYYRTIVHVDGGQGGVLDIPVSVQSGSVFYQEDFSGPFMAIGEISGQDRWYSDKSGTIEGSIGNGMAYNSMVVTNTDFAVDGELARIVCSGGYYGYECTIDTPSNLIVGVEFDFYWPSDSQAANFDVTGELWKHRPFLLNMRKSGEEAFFHVTKIQEQGAPEELAGPQFECDAWHHLLYKLDFRQQLVLEVSVDDAVCQPQGLALMPQGEKILRYLHTINLGSDGVQKTPGQEDYVSGVCIDNMQVYEVERAKVGRLGAPARLNLGAREGGTIGLSNDGTDPCVFSAQVPDGAPLSVSPMNGVVTSAFQVAVTRTGSPKGGFYRIPVVFDAGKSGCATTMVTFAQGGVYYSADFEEPYFVQGDIQGQDGWYYDTDATLSNMVARVEEEDGSNCLRYYAAGYYCGTMIPLEIPAYSRFRFSARIKVPEEGEDESILYIKQFGHKPLQEFWIWRDKKNGLAQLYVKNYEDLELPPVSLDEWFDFSYTVDMAYDRWMTTDIQFGDCVTNVEHCQIYFENERDGEPVNALSICSSGDYWEGKLANILVDDILVTDADVPEPACLVLLLALLALGRRR